MGNILIGCAFLPEAACFAILAATEYLDWRSARREWLLKRYRRTMLQAAQRHEFGSIDVLRMPYTELQTTPPEASLTRTTRP